MDHATVTRHGQALSYYVIPYRGAYAVAEETYRHGQPVVRVVVTTDTQEQARAELHSRVIDRHATGWERVSDL